MVIVNLLPSFTHPSTISQRKFIPVHFKAGVNMNSSEILVSLKRGWKGNKGLWNTTRQLPDPTMAPQVVGRLFGVYVPIFNSKF